MKNLKMAILLLSSTLAGCAGARPAVMSGCDYESRTGNQEYVFVLPTFEEYAEDKGAFDFYTEPRRSAKLRLSSFRYQRHYVGKRYKNTGIVAGTDGSYHVWLMEDCRLLYSPVEAGLPQGKGVSGD